MLTERFWPRKQSLPTYLLAALLYLALTFAFVQALTTYGRRSEANELLSVTVAAAASLSRSDTASLTAIPADASSEAFKRLHHSLRRMRQAMPHIRYAYLMARGQQHYVFLVDAEDLDSPTYSAPGDAYTDQTQGLDRVYATSAAVLEPPYRDQWGYWVTGLAPITDAQGRVIGVLGLDVSAEHWQAQLRHYRVLGLTIALLLTLPLAVLGGAWRLQRRSSQRLARLNRSLAAELTERQRSEQQLRLAAAVIENTAEGVIILTAEGRVQTVNSAYERLTGETAAELLGQTLNVAHYTLEDGTPADGITEEVHRNGKWQGILLRQRKSGERFPQETTINALYDADGAVTHYACIVSDFTKRQLLEDQLRALSMIDGLTGIANRRMFDDTLKREWARAKRSGAPLALLMIDVDYFKRYNDHYGHLAGDQALCAVAEAIKDSGRRPSDLCARYGGEEFAMVLPSTTAEQAAVMAERVRRAVESLRLPHEGSAVHRHVTVSVGYASVLPASDESAERDLLALADESLYRAKAEGRNRIAAQ